jgi:hypothetical protein
MKAELIRQIGFTAYWAIRINGYILRMSCSRYNQLMGKYGIDECEHGSNEAKLALEKEFGL